MAKPICIVYVPKNLAVNGVEFSYLDGIKLAKQWMNDYPDYYFFIFPDSEVNQIDLKVIYEADFNQIKYQELKKLIEEQIKLIK